MAQFARIGGLAALLVTALGAGCMQDPDTACGSDLVYMYKLCAPPEFFESLNLDGDDDEEQVAGDGDTPTGDAGGDAAPGEGAQIGEFCDTDKDCTPSAPYCAKQPGAAPYCTIIDCDVANPSAVCPPDWICFDVSIVAGSGPKACVQP